MKLCLYIFPLLALLVFAGCEPGREETTAPQQTTAMKERPVPEGDPVVLLQEPIKVALVETATAALPIWQKYAPLEPVLILFSNDPFLEPVPEKLLPETTELLHKGAPEQIKERTVDITANPLLLHNMAVDAAIKARFFSEFIWILPKREETPPPSLEELKRTLVDSGLISQDEADTLTDSEGVFRGYFRDIPVTIATLSSIPIPTNPALIHLDLSFFRPLYKNEVTTPLYPLVTDALRKIRSADLSSLAVGVSYSNLGGVLPLKIRFLGKDVAHLISQPEALDAELPELQARRAQNLYLEQFMKKDEILENCLAMVKLAPDDATARFDLYNIQRAHKNGALALEALDQAAALDPVYALEYLNLVDAALEKQRPDAALEMLSKAHAAFPDNPLILMREARLQGRLGHKAAAMALLRKLKTLPWSKAYDSGMMQQLARLEELIMNPPDSETQQ